MRGWRAARTRRGLMMARGQVVIDHRGTARYAVAMSRRALRRELQRVIAQIRRRYRPDAILLFGSLARGRQHADSDIDLVVLKRTRKPFTDRLREVALLHHATVGVDILVYTPDEWQRFQQDRRSFVATEVMKHGRVLYRAA